MVMVVMMITMMVMMAVMIIMVMVIVVVMMMIVMMIANIYQGNSMIRITVNSLRFKEVVQFVQHSQMRNCQISDFPGAKIHSLNQYTTYGPVLCL